MKEKAKTLPFYMSEAVRSVGWTNFGTKVEKKDQIKKKRDIKKLANKKTQVFSKELCRVTGCEGALQR